MENKGCVLGKGVLICFMLSVISCRDEKEEVEKNERKNKIDGKS